MLYAWLSLGALILFLIALPVSLIALLFRSTRRKAKWAALVSTIGVVASFVSFGYHHDVLNGGKAFVRPSSAARGQPEEMPPFSAEVQRDILKHKIIVGMTPQEARLAGGGFFYKVEADPLRWPRGSDPLVVIGRQATQPDESKITLTFRNATQFDTPEPTTFRVEIRRGRVTEIIAVDAPRI
jgi:hypothetical protein